MIRYLTTLLYFSLLSLLNSAVLAAETIASGLTDTVLQVHMAGDSTMAIKHPKDYPETGWGVPFATFFDNSVLVINYAENGRSTRTFIEDGLWQQLISAVQPGDYVIIQFGHNDEVEDKRDRYTTPDEYQHNLQFFIDSTLAKHAKPILMTPIIRRYFDAQGELVASHPYAKWVRRVASNNPDIDFIDMETITGQYFLALGDAASATRFMHIPRDLHPNYPNGIRDNTHLNQLGAREVAQLVLQQLKASGHELASRTRKADPKHLNYRY